MDDDELDGLIRRASAVDGDDRTLARDVLRRVRTGAAPARRAGLAPGLAVAGFAALLVATPVLIASAPLDPADVALGIALGDGVLEPGLSAVLGGRP